MGSLKQAESVRNLFYEQVRNSIDVSLSDNKLSLIENRLRKRLLELNLNSLDDYFIHIRSSPDEFKKCLVLLTTHKTEWFREIEHFQWLQKEIPSLNVPLKIWSAACSSGEEVYSLLFLCIKNGLLPNQVRILGSDVSPTILDKARALSQSGAFATQLSFLEDKMRHELPPNLMKQYLSQSVKFKQHNLVTNEPLNGMMFDVIFARNVLIYFNPETIKHVVNQLLKNLRPNGVLIIGLSESIRANDFNLVSLGDSMYRYQP